MKFVRLLLQAFGPFSDTTLDFAASPAHTRPEKTLGRQKEARGTASDRALWANATRLNAEGINDDARRVSGCSRKKQAQQESAETKAAPGRLRQRTTKRHLARRFWFGIAATALPLWFMGRGPKSAVSGEAET